MHNTSFVDALICFSLEFLTKFKVIESEGVDVDGNNMWVRSYAVSTSNDSVGGWMYHGSSVTQVTTN